ncbi:endolytic transglycosylase MltG [Candidatus Woesebacteria bacterium]|nr:endolytic transglycosylase MltG [Candidatus Woesebacteria bacterium]
MKRTSLLIGSILVVGMVAIAGIGATAYLFSPKDTAAQKQKVVIKKGDTLIKVATQLEASGIVRTAWSLRIAAKVGAPTTIHPGTYELSASMNPRQILETLSTEPEEAWVTFLEGWRVEEYAQELEKNFPETFNAQEFLALAKEKEGRLFPDTYLLERDVSTPMLISLLSNTFDKRYAQAVEGGINDSVLSQQQLIILASLLEREARGEEAMKMVAGILLNRLRIGMPLQVDATLQYAKGYDNKSQTWWPTPRSEDKSIDSPFNTYKNNGLPPSAICNPGLEALKAVLSPTKSNYLYYISDTKGKMHYAATYPEHQKNIEIYLK